nr:lamin tail domain-containing protein [Candidatus Brocadiales bacterium]
QYSATDSYSHTSLTGNTAYYYKAWSYDGSNYSSGITTNVTTVKVEPTNHPTSLTATTSYQSIALAWTDAVTGSQAPDGYLILGETDATITDPTDGTAVSNDTDASDNTLAMSITHGAGASYTFSSLTASTTYYFEIFSYTNSGSSIDYKTDGTIITANATTGVAPVFVINEIHADPDATNGDANGDAAVSTADDEFVEIVNRSGSSVDISNWVITDGFSDRHVVTNGTTIGDGVSLVVFGGGTPTNIPGISQVASTGALGLNNSGDDVTLKDSEGGTIVTYSYGSEGGDNQSIARNPDYTGDFVRHSTITGNAVLFSPGKTNTGDVSLPVDLSYFTASSARSDEITLNWVTESELENLGFIVERRNTNVESLWGVIADYMSHPELQGQGSVAHRTEYTFTDNTVEVDQAYDYRLADVSFDGEKEYHHLYVLDVSSAELPVEFQLLQNYPNPFNPSTTLSYALPEQTMVKLMVFDIRGQEVLTLYDASQQPGHHQVLWKGIDKAGMRVNTGVYFARLEAGEHSKTMKMVYLR